MKKNELQTEKENKKLSNNISEIENDPEFYKGDSHNKHIKSINSKKQTNSSKFTIRSKTNNENKTNFDEEENLNNNNNKLPLLTSKSYLSNEEENFGKKYLQSKLQNLSISNEIMNSLKISLENIHKDLKNNKFSFENIKKTPKNEYNILINKNNHLINLLYKQECVLKKDLNDLNFNENLLKNETDENLINNNIKISKLKEINNKKNILIEKINSIHFEISKLLKNEFEKENKIFINKKKIFENFKKTENFINKLKIFEKNQKEAKKKREKDYEKTLKIKEKEEEKLNLELKEKKHEILLNKIKIEKDLINKRNKINKEKLLNIKNFINEKPNKKKEYLYISMPKQYEKNKEKFYKNEIFKHNLHFKHFSHNDFKSFKNKFDNEIENKNVERENKLKELKNEWKQRTNRLPEYKNPLFKIMDDNNIVEINEKKNQEINKLINNKKNFAEKINHDFDAKKNDFNDENKKKDKNNYNKKNKLNNIKINFSRNKNKNSIIHLETEIKSKENKKKYNPTIIDNKNLKWELKLKTDSNEILENEIKKHLIKKSHKINLNQTTINKTINKNKSNNNINDYLKENKNKFFNFDFDYKINSKNLKKNNSNDVFYEINNINNKANKLDELAKKTEKLASFQGGITKNPTLIKKVGGLMINSIKAKLAILDCV